MRIVRLIATPLLLLALLALLLWGAFWGWQNLTAPLPEPEPTPCVTVSTDLITVQDVSVNVYNAGFKSGLANRVSTRLRGVGFNIMRVDNTEERVTSGVVIRTNEENRPAIRLVTSYFADFTLEFDDRIDGTIDVLVGSDFQGFGDKPLKSVTAGKTLCVMPTPSVTPTTSPTTTAKQPSPTATRTPAGR